MLNKITEGKTVSYAHTSSITSGSPLKIGNLLAVACKDGAANEEIEYAIEGVYELDKLNTDVFAVGSLLYWDNTNSRLTTTATGNIEAGVAYKAAANPSTKGQVILGRTHQSGA